MSNKRRLMYCALVALVLLAGLGIYNHCTRKPVVVGVERDTVVVYDTIPHYYPKPVDSAVVRYVTKVLPMRPDTHHFADVGNMIDGNSVSSVSNSANSVTDSVAVVVPITTKHYRAMEYDAWVSGYEPSLDSIKVYQKTEVVTITKTIKDQKHFFLDAGAGCEYIPNTKTAVPFTELGLSFKSGKFGIGAYGGYSHDINENKAMPYAKAKITFDIISF